MALQEVYEQDITQDLEVRRPRRRQRKWRWVGWTLSVLLWAGLAYGGFYYAQQYFAHMQNEINQRIDEVKLNNEKEFQTLHQEMAQVKEQMQGIQEQLALTKDTIHGTDNTKKALQERMANLDQQLKELKASIQKLEDTARAW